MLVRSIDKNLIELKLKLNKHEGNQQLDVYMLLPKSLDANSYSYPPELFFRHLYNEQVMYCDKLGLNSKRLHESIARQESHSYRTNRDYRRDICNIGLQFVQALKMDIRNALEYKQPLPELLDNIDRVSNNFRDHQPTTDVLLRHFRYVDEYINWFIQQELLKILNQDHSLEKAHRNLLIEKFKYFEQYATDQNYKLLSEQAFDEKQVSRLYLLKDYLNRYHLLQSERKRKGVLLEQGIFSMAAFMSMAFATIIAFSTQQSFGNFSTPFFFALVFSYIFKDRFKELSRNYIYKKIMDKRCLFDYQITDPINDTIMANFEDGCRYIQHKSMSEELKKKLYSTRNSNRNRSEDILHYQKKYRLNNHQIAKGYSGIQDKIVINLQKILRNMPKESQTIYSLNDKTSQRTKVDKNQLIYMVVDLMGKVPKVFTIVVNSKGIVSMKHNQVD